MLSWRPLRTSDLPGFVCDWRKPGLNRVNVGPSGFSKVALVTLQRMETPVIYFYSSRDMDVDVSVDFPKGLITEWYPQATRIGPSRPLNATGFSTGTLTTSRAQWNRLRLIAPTKGTDTNSARLPQDISSSHYFAARETASDIVQMNFAGPTNQINESEKFIFYRGAGSFKTPLTVHVDAHDDVFAENTGPDKLANLFLVSVRDTGHGKIAAFTVVDKAAPGATAPFPSLKPANFVPLEKFQTDIAAQMQSALVAAGLYKAEAAAMVATWKDSWFAEEGDRVFYILPRAWTDETLPMTLEPKPLNLVRVMVGRAEIVMPKTVQDLSHNLTRAAAGDADARASAAAQISTIGRFIDPALQLVNLNCPSNDVATLGYQILAEVAQPKLTAQSKFE